LAIKPSAELLMWIKNNWNLVSKYAAFVKGCPHPHNNLKLKVLNCRNYNMICVLQS